MLALVAAALISSLVPMNDLGSAPYDYGYYGGLWENGSNAIPPDHLLAGVRFAERITPLDGRGKPSPDGKIVFLAVGAEEASKIFASFASVVSDAPLKNPSVVLMDGTAAGLDASSWIRPANPTYDRIDRFVLKPSDLTPLQVQVAWVDLATDNPVRSLPIQDADAYRLKGALGATLRALKSRYPNLQIAYLSSRVFGGYATSARNPEPFAYETAFSVRWVTMGQVLTMRQAAIGPYWDTRLGDLNYDHGVIPWVTWGPYLWASSTPRSDGLEWDLADFETDGETLSPAGATKAGVAMFRFMTTETVAGYWLWKEELSARRRPGRH